MAYPPPLNNSHTFMGTCRLSPDSTTKGTYAKLLAPTERSKIPKRQRKVTPKSYNQHAVFVRGTPVRAKFLESGKSLRIGCYSPQNLKSVGSSARRPKVPGTRNSRPPRSAPKEPKNQTTGAPKSTSKHALSVRGIPLREKQAQAEKTL